uniref:DUF6361 family protein n=1 Tax=Cronobacter sakazakii TaxID=28141 RepID=UPI001F2D3041
HARLFSEVMHGAALSYNYQLAEKIEREGLRELHRDEAEFIRDRLQAACPHSLLAFLALQDDKPTGAYPWEYANSGRFSATHQTILHHARLFSEVMHGAALSYNYQLAEKIEREGLRELH